MNCVVKSEGPDSLIARAFKKDFKGTYSIVFYRIAITASFFFPIVSIILYLLVAVMWIIPDTRIEKNY